MGAACCKAAQKREDPKKKDAEKDIEKPNAEPSKPVKKADSERREPAEGAPKKGAKPPADMAKLKELMQRPGGVNSLGKKDMQLFKQLRGACWTDDDQKRLDEFPKMFQVCPEKADINEYQQLKQRQPDLCSLQEQDEDSNQKMVGRGDRVCCKVSDSGLPGDNETATRKQLMWGFLGDIEFVDEDGDYLIMFFKDTRNEKPIEPPFQQWVFKHNFTGDKFDKVFVPGVHVWKRNGGRALEPLMDVTTLIDIRWLRKFAKGEVMETSKGIVPAWQNVPEDGVAQLQHMQHFCERTPSGPGLSVAVLSYGWAAKSHPDPTGEQLQHLVAVLEAIVKECDTRQEEVRRKVDGLQESVCSWGMVWDFMSFPQRGYTKAFDANTDDRTPVQINRFKKGLKGINEWYGHPETFTLVLNTPMPATAENHAEYKVRGWCMFERRMSSLVKDATCYLELNKEHLEDIKEWSDMTRLCAQKRPAPMAPDVFTRILLEGVEKENAKPGTGIKFTSGKDLTEIVIPQYEKGFIRIMGSAKEFQYWGLDWQDDDAEHLAATLKWMYKNNAIGKLTSLFIKDNKITDRGGKAIADAIREGAFQDIVEFSFIEEGIGEATAEAMAAAIDTGLFGSGPLAKEWRAMGLGGNVVQLKFGYGQRLEDSVWKKLQEVCQKHDIQLK